MAIDATVDNFRSVADMDTVASIAAIFVGFMLAEVTRAVVEPRRNLPDELYGVVAILVLSAYGAYGGPYWKGAALGAGFNSFDAAADRFGIQSAIMGAV